MLHQQHKNRSLIYLASASIAIASIAFAHVSHAAILSAYASAPSVSVGNLVSVSINVDSAGVAINTAGATIQFPTDLLEVMSVSQSPSIFSLWVQNPVFSNTDGTVSFTGGLPTPGYVGQNGQIVTIVFRARKAGSASVVITNGSVLANDGSGTDVLTAQGSATIKIGASTPETPAIAVGSLPPLPIITSATEPQQNDWYPSTSASFNWTIPNGVNSIQTLLSRESNSVPTVTYDNSVSERTVNNLHDGVLYFHLRYMNDAGWGPIATYKVMLDTTPPENFALNVETKGVQNVVTLNAVDAMSGIASYSVQVDNEPSVTVENSSLINGQYVLPTQTAGQHTLAVITYDKAGNHTESDTTFTSPTIAVPTITVTPHAATRGDTVTIAGQTQYPNVPVNVSVQPEGKVAKTYAATTGSDGSYSVATDALDVPGAVDIWSQLAFSSTTLSGLSEKVTIMVNDTLVVHTSKSVIYGLSYILPAIFLALLLLFLLYLGWHKFFSLKKRLQKEAKEVANDVHKAMTGFKGELENQLDKLEEIKADRELNKKEEKAFRELRQNIENIDEFIEKKIQKLR
ncbi:MAG: hypothetical protein P4L61_04435 [Candidatus Pacebacteria bacterium]|nr:hypothetical protein [Candidatus Paceibacterota bacterium]